MIAQGKQIPPPIRLLPRPPLDPAVEVGTVIIDASKPRFK